MTVRAGQAQPRIDPRIAGTIRVAQQKVRSKGIEVTGVVLARIHELAAQRLDSDEIARRVALEFGGQRRGVPTAVLIGAGAGFAFAGPPGAVAGAVAGAVLARARGEHPPANGGMSGDGTYKSYGTVPHPPGSPVDLDPAAGSPDKIIKVAGAGASIAALFGPEAVPIGIVIGGFIGAIWDALELDPAVLLPLQGMEKRAELGLCLAHKDTPMFGSSGIFPPAEVPEGKRDLWWYRVLSAYQTGDPGTAGANYWALLATPVLSLTRSQQGIKWEPPFWPWERRLAYIPIPGDVEGQAWQYAERSAPGDRPIPSSVRERFKIVSWPEMGKPAPGA